MRQRCRELGGDCAIAGDDSGTIVRARAPARPPSPRTVRMHDAVLTAGQGIVPAMAMGLQIRDARDVSRR